jgi:hypothetical protein
VPLRAIGPWECFWSQEMASGVERGRGGGSYGGEGWGGAVRCKKPGRFISLPLLWLLPSLLSSASVRFLFFSRPFPGNFPEEHARDAAGNQSLITVYLIYRSLKRLLPRAQSLGLWSWRVRWCTVLVYRIRINLIRERKLWQR